MSTDISLQTTTYQVGNKQWLLQEPDVKLNVTLDISKFTSGTHYPNGFIPSGTVLGKVTATGLFGPYDAAASDGRQTAYGLTYADVRAVRQNGSTAAKVGTGAVVNDAIVSVGKLPFATGTGITGALDGTSNTGTVTASASLTAAKAAVNQIRWEA
ncbi:MULTISPECIES: head decoration protein [unclassified Mycobacterium]|uniref:head decoration protein n=1 Tax=unclassified Mycobacterium TaxID=2642494 RepID=UPI002741EF6A|nr:MULTISPECIES: head decoration protein [unclassified Mycobacterium]MDP7703187.1 head decoration protein [Mycobacterium sp. TY815]MDP7721792.1 head decoration protein [Mycobacterium sp. TY814]